jgi:hypothetical protein
MEEASAANAPTEEERVSGIAQQSDRLQAALTPQVGKEPVTSADSESEAGRKRSSRIGLMECKRREEDERRARDELEAQKRAEDKRVARLRKKHERLQYQQYPLNQGGEEGRCAALSFKEYMVQAISNWNHLLCAQVLCLSKCCEVTHWGVCHY